MPESTVGEIEDVTINGCRQRVRTCQTRASVLAVHDHYADVAFDEALDFTDERDPRAPIEDRRLDLTGAAGAPRGFYALGAFDLLAQRTGRDTVLSIEPEPRSLAGDTRELEAFLAHLERALDPGLVRAHLGACLDACHSAVEFEAPAEVLRRGLRLPLGKLQVSSALALRDPAAHPEARAALLALDEPRYLHQTTGRRGAELLRCDDLPELGAALADPASPWLACEEWRTHFHVPVDLEALGGLGTTRAHAEALVDALLADPGRWGDPDLHLELETYTWDVLPGAARGAGDLVDGLQREYAPVLRALQRGGWLPADPSPPGGQESAGAR
jgi:hypothetical protein